MSQKSATLPNGLKYKHETNNPKQFVFTGARLRCLDYLVKAQPKLDADSKLFQAVIPEAVVACKDLNQKCREAAFQLLIDIGETLTARDQIQQYVGMLMTGLAGDVKLVSSTVVALSSVLRHFTGKIHTFQNK